MQKIETIILSANIAGLSAGHHSSHQGQKIIIFEKDNAHGELAKTIDFNGFKFDVGKHNFGQKKVIGFFPLPGDYFVKN